MTPAHATRSLTPPPVAPPVDLLQLRDGTVVTVRTAHPGDADMIQSYIRGLSPDSRRSRFLWALNELSPPELHRVTHSSERQFTLVAETVAGGRRTMIGEARSAVAPDGRFAEVSLSVAETWRRNTLGTQMLGIVMDRVRDLGVDYLTADALRSNGAVTALARKMGFGFGPLPADARLIQLITKISLPRPAAELASLRLS
jgi:acetyltransferase